MNVSKLSYKTFTVIQNYLKTFLKRKMLIQYSGTHCRNWTHISQIPEYPRNIFMHFPIYKVHSKTNYSILQKYLKILSNIFQYFQNNLKIYFLSVPHNFPQNRPQRPKQMDHEFQSPTFPRALGPRKIKPPEKGPQHRAHRGAWRKHLLMGLSLSRLPPQENSARQKISKIHIEVSPRLLPAWIYKERSKNLYGDAGYLSVSMAHAISLYSDIDTSSLAGARELTKTAHRELTHWLHTLYPSQSARNGKFFIFIPPQSEIEERGMSKGREAR